MDKRSGVQVVVNETVANLMGKVMSLPSSELEARATAKLSGGGRLCVLTLDPNADAAIRLDTASKLTAERLLGAVELDRQEEHPGPRQRLSPRRAHLLRRRL